MVDDLIAAMNSGTLLHRHFFHFTDDRNLPLIREHGLLSTQRLRDLDIRVPAPGGNDWSFDADRRAGMDGFVHLCFMNEHPMAYLATSEGRIQQVRYLQINPTVLRIPGALATNDVSNKAGVVPLPVAEALPNLDLEVIYRRTDWKDPAIKQRRKSAKKYEILIPNHVPVELIENLGDG